MSHALTHAQMAQALRLGKVGVADAGEEPARGNPGGRAGASITAAMLVVTVLGAAVASEKRGGRHESLRIDAAESARGGSIPRRGAEPRNPSNQEPSKMLSKITGVTAAAAVGVSASIAGAQDASRVLSSPAIGAGVVIPHASAQNAPIATGHMTIEFWLRHESGIGRVVNKRDCSYEGYTILTRPVEGGTQIEVGFGTGEVAFLWVAGVVPTGQWRHVAVVWSSSAGTVRLVVDGSTVSSTTIAPGQVPGTSEYPLRFAEQCGGGFVGAMDNVRLWSVARTDAEIRRHRFVEFGADMAATVQGLVGCWDFQDPGEVVDRRGLNPPGSFYGGASSAEQSRPGSTVRPSVQWRADSGGNGHWYQVSLVQDPLAWSEAREIARATGGRLLSVNSSAEQGCVEPLLVAAKDEQGCNPAIFIGLAKRVGEEWRWEDGTALTYTNWACGEPFDPDYPEGKVGMYNPASCEPYCVPHLKWNDVRSDVIHPLHRGLAIEWSADCNADGIVDYGQILGGQLADVNANNVPDSCECLSDINDDGWVDGVDLGIVLASWSTESADAPADLNRDGAVDGADLGVLLAAWGACGP